MDPMIDTEDSEIWKPVFGYEGRYEVSSLGRVRSLPLVVLVAGKEPYVHPRSGRVLSQTTTPRGYKRVTLYKESAEKCLQVHALVCAAFHGQRPLGAYALHRDGVCDNNKPANLRWGTAQENSDDAKLHGAILRGERHPGCKFSDAQVQEIRSLAEAGHHTLREIAGMYGTQKAYVWKLTKRYNRD